MPARRLVVLAAALSALVSGCTSSEQATGDSAPARAAASPAAEETPEPEPVTVGGQPAIAPCDLLRLDEVRRLFPRSGMLYRTEQFLRPGLDDAARASLDGTWPRHHTCGYTLYDPRNTYVDIAVRQYPKVKDARKSWAYPLSISDGSLARQLRGPAGDGGEAPPGGADLERLGEQIAQVVEGQAGGTRLPGVDRRILLDRDRDRLEALVGRATVAFELRRSGSDPWSGEQLPATLRTGVVLLTDVLSRHDAGELGDELSSTPAVSNDWASVVDVCELAAGDDVVAALGPDHAWGPGVVNQVRIGSKERLRQASPRFRSVENECRLEAVPTAADGTLQVQDSSSTPSPGARRRGPVTWSVEVRLWSPPTGVSPQDVFEAYAVRDLVPIGRSYRGYRQLAADRLEEQDPVESAQWYRIKDSSDLDSGRSLTGYVGTDEHVLLVSISGSRASDDYRGVAPSREQLREVVTAVSERLADATG